jgi:transposase
MPPAQKGDSKSGDRALARGLSTKIHFAADALGNPLRIILTAGQVHEVTQAVALVDGLPLISLIADKGYDTNDFRAYLAATQADVVIPPRARRSILIAYDKAAYEQRHRIECFINKIKHYRRIATRFDKTALSFFSLLCLAASYDLAALNVNRT